MSVTRESHAGGLRVAVEPASRRFGMPSLRPAQELLLPPRVREAIAQQEDRSERLIGWIQLAIVVTFGLLYLVTPTTSGPDAPFRPVPYILGTYLALTLIRIAWSYRARLPDWSLAFSALFDIGLLMLLIWSFHLQYDQPPSFYLKAPTLLYVFIFIGLRALRFDPRFVLITGVMAAVGWGGMIVIVVASEGGEMMITRDYVEYMTANAILLGAEFDKIISILMVTLILSVALGRGRELLVRSVAEGIAAKELSRFFAPEVAQHIKGAKKTISAGEGQLREAAVVFLDLRGFTSLVEQEAPAGVMALLSDYQARIIPILQRHGGSIDKFLGDGIMASFGAAEPSATYAADALGALQDVLAEAEVWQAERAAAGRPAPRVNGAVTTGTVLFGAVGDESRLEITVIGDPVNLSAKLEKHNKISGTRALATTEAFARAQAQGYAGVTPVRDLAAEVVEGVVEPLDLVVLAE
ncbi:adenylate/guanylate cyclase domain-containing protein [Algihabitans albus]|uniref:adenylate/guanylate cyclase domain-containing protein n=1 Tax=Algihabitans albus TaxID=2164067 RepID=UPI001ABCC4EC|nr:adenylate/guanylate cyclase domain-containing protein [Algihabitans albus]